MKKIGLTLVAVFIAAFLIGAAWGQEQAIPGATQQTCFIMKGNPVNPKIFADYKGYRVYFCCNDCRGLFLQTPEKFFRAMQEAKFPLEKAPV